MSERTASARPTAQRAFPARCDALIGGGHVTINPCKPFSPAVGFTAAMLDHAIGCSNRFNMALMADATIWHFIKFFREESHAERFIAGELYLNTIKYFKKMENNDSDGRDDAAEAVAFWYQPSGTIMTIIPPKGAAIEITSEDIAGPLAISLDAPADIHVFCLYAVYTTGFKCVDGKFKCEPEDFGELQRQLKIDDRCLRLGPFAVIIDAAYFLHQLNDALRSQGYPAREKLVEYYDDDTFNGAIPPAKIPFRKQKRFEYQREFRVCAYNTMDSPLTINIGDLSAICRKVESANVPAMFELKQVC